MPRLAADRADLLHALALVVRGREPIPEGLRRLANDDPLLEPWCQRLVPDLEQGRTLGDTLRRHRVVEAREGRLLDQHRDPGHALTQIADGIFRRPAIVWVACWLPSVVALGTGMALVGAHALFGGFSALIAQDLGLPRGDWPTTATWTGTGVLGVVALQAVLREVRGLRWIDLLLFPNLQRALALADLHELAPLQTPASGWRGWWAATGLGATRRGAPPWDRPWRTWWMLTRWRLTRGQQEGMRALPRPEERLRAVAAWDARQAHRDLLIEAERCRPWVTLTVALGLLVGATIGSAQPLMKVVEALGGGSGGP